LAAQREVQLDSGEIRLKDSLDETRHAVSADILLGVIKGLQKAVRLLAAQEEGVHVAKRFKPSADLSDHYTLLLGVPGKGSYCQPLEVVDRRPLVTEAMDAGADFFPLQATLGLINAIAHDDLQAAQLAVPDERIRRMAFEAVELIIPRDTWGLELTAGGMAAYVDARSRETVQKWLAMPFPEESVHIVAKVIGFEFEKKRVKLQHPPSGRIFDAPYEINVEESLLRERREMVQISGLAMLDDEAMPTELIEVTAINFIDLSPLTIHRVDVDDVHLVPRTPLSITPTLSEPDFQLFEARSQRIGIDAYSRTRADLLPAVLEEIAFVWECYALEDPANLTSDAQLLRERLLAAFEVA
jgi:hypothetical protein